MCKRDWRVFTWVFFGVLAGAVIYEAQQPRVYESVGILSFREEAEVERARVADGLPPIDGWRGTTAEAEARLVELVVKRLDVADRERLLAPYGVGNGTDDRAVEARVRANHRAVFDDEAKTLTLRFRHPDRLFAARVAGLFCGEMTAIGARYWIDESLRDVEVLKTRADEHQRRVDELDAAMSAYRKTRIEEAGARFEADEHYRGLQDELTQEKRSLGDLILQMRDNTMIAGPVEFYWHAVGQPLPADEGDYLRLPIGVRLAWGFGAGGSERALSSRRFETVIGPRNERSHDKYLTIR